MSEFASSLKLLFSDALFSKSTLTQLMSSEEKPRPHFSLFHSPGILFGVTIHPPLWTGQGNWGPLENYIYIWRQYPCPSIPFYVLYLNFLMKFPLTSIAQTYSSISTDCQFNWIKIEWLLSKTEKFGVKLFEANNLTTNKAERLKGTNEPENSVRANS